MLRCVSRDDQWRMLRKAWQPAFSSESLAGYLHLMDQVTGPGRT